MDTAMFTHVYYCYAHKDEALHNTLEKHLTTIVARPPIRHWDHRAMRPGEERQQAIDHLLEITDLILLLISPDFLASNDCSKVMERSLELHEIGSCDVIPIILRPTDWQDAPFNHLQALPQGAKAVTSWRNRDEAFQNISQNIRDILKKRSNARKTMEEWLNEGHAFVKLKRFDKALLAYRQAVRQAVATDIAFGGDRTHQALTYQAYALNKLRRYAEALTLCEQIISGSESNRAFAYTNKGHALDGLKRYEEAITACNKALSLDPNDAMAYNNKGYALEHLGRYEEATEAYEHAIRVNPNYAIAYANTSVSIGGKLPKNAGIKLPRWRTWGILKQQGKSVPSCFKEAVHVSHRGTIYDQRYVSQRGFHQRDCATHRTGSQNHPADRHSPNTGGGSGPTQAEAV